VSVENIQIVFDVYNMALTDFESFVLSGTAGAVIYALLCKIWPVQVYPTGQHSTERMGWEKMVPTEGFFHDDETMPQYIQDRVLIGEEPITAVESREDVVRNDKSIKD
jgi:hypothetical protein